MRPEKRKKENGNCSVEHPSIRCAIYTRKSTEEGLEQAFNTLDAQRDAGEAYINSQRQEGWVPLPQQYDDGGYTGANMDRPALKRLLADVESGVANCVVVYKVDRLTRSLLDFSRIIEILDKNNATFRLGNPAIQHDHIPRPPDSEYLALVCPVRARDDIRTHARQKWPRRGAEVSGLAGTPSLATMSPRRADRWW